MSHQIPGMPACGTCKQCGGLLHFASEVQNGFLCGACGPGGCNWQGGPVPVQSKGGKALPAKSEPVKPVVQVMSSPDEISKTLQARGMDPRQCPFCLLKGAGMNVSTVVVPHTEDCPNKDTAE